MVISSFSGDLLCAIYFIRGGQVEILQNNELQAILGRNDILGENPCDTTAAGKSQCVVRGMSKEFFVLFVFTSKD